MNPGKSKKEETPLMAQYNQIKSKHPDALLLFRVGDFYETFGDDAIKTSKALGIVLTRRANGSASHIELAGFPHHSIDTYLPKLIKSGYRVAICDQLEDPKLTKTIVKRGVTEMVSPGVSLQTGVLESNHANYLAAIYMEGKKMGVAFLDFSTGEFKVSEDSQETILRLIASMDPSEMLIPKSQQSLFSELGIPLVTSKRNSRVDDWAFGEDRAREVLQRQFKVSSLEGFGINHIPLAIRAAGACLQYLDESQHSLLPHLVTIERIEQQHYLFMDSFTIRNLELINKIHESSKTLLEVINQTQTPMGARLLRGWLLLPLKEKEGIEERLNLVDVFFQNILWTKDLRLCLSKVGDLERLISKIALQKTNPREIWTLYRSLKAIGELVERLGKNKSVYLKPILEKISLEENLQEFIALTLHPEAPVNLLKGSVIADNVNSELDELRKIAFGGKDYLIELQNREAEKTGISSLKISFNSVFGYYFEVTHTHKDKIPSDWIRKQTLVNAERYISSELKEYEEKILGAEEKIYQLESSLYKILLENILSYVYSLQKNAHMIAHLDVLTNFAVLAYEKNYTKPILNFERTLNIWEGRHPVIENSLPIGESYIPNDLFLNPDQTQIMMITGPNMAGKSAILRQTAQIVILAQMGCYVPAKKVEMGIIDRVFTRVGASDNITAGQSTFMVEMIETAGILNFLSDRSLILLDEIGRGTSTYDGISIAWSIAEYLHNHPKYRAKTLFATHYHELNEMEKQFPRIKNFTIAVKEMEDSILFLRKLIPGGSEHSFGIQVAKMAGVPGSIVSRAKKLLQDLELGHSPWGTERDYPGTERFIKCKKSFLAAEEGIPYTQISPDRRVGDDSTEPKLTNPLPDQGHNLNSINQNHLEIEIELKKVDLDFITPMEAMMILSRLKKLCS